MGAKGAMVWPAPTNCRCNDTVMTVPHVGGKHHPHHPHNPRSESPGASWREPYRADHPSNFHRT